MSPLDVCGLLLLWLCHWVPAGCYSNGKVTSACGSMKPHHDVPAQTSPSPYHLQTNTTKFRPGEHVQVILSGTSYFEGFLLQARDATNLGSTSTVGTFTLTDPARTQLLTCNHKQGSAVSHTSDARQTRVVVTWIAPHNAPREVQFLLRAVMDEVLLHFAESVLAKDLENVTVVTHYRVFWVRQPGPIISQHGVTPHPPQSTTALTTTPKTTASILPGPFTSEGCGQWKSCLLDPPDCNPQEDPLCFFLSMTPEGSEKMSVTFELSGPAEGYVAFALSRDSWMGNDDVYMCVKDGNKVSVDAAFVSGRTDPEDLSKSGLSLVSWRLVDGVIQCMFSRPVSLTNQEPGRFDLDQEYFLFIANGHAENGEIWKHHRQPLISTFRKHITGPPEVLTGSRGPIILKLHGAVMLLAWMLTGSVGAVIASFYKSDWPNQTLLGQKVWFQVHRGLMMVTVSLTILAFCLPFFYRGHWSKHAGVHPYLGCCVLALALIQPIMAAFRPSPDSDRRFIFSWAHWAVGSVTEIMAVAAMFLGVRQPSLILPPPWTTHVLIGYVTWLASFRTVLLIHKYLKSKSSVSDDKHPILSDQSQFGRWTSLIKSFILAALILGNFGFLVALLSSIAQI